MTVIAEDITVRVATGAEDAIGAAVMVGGIERAALQMAWACRRLLLLLLLLLLLFLQRHVLRAGSGRRVRDLVPVAPLQ